MHNKKQYFNDWTTKVIHWATFMSPSYHVKNTLQLLSGAEPNTDIFKLICFLARWNSTPCMVCTC